MAKIKVIVLNNEGMKVKEIENSLKSFQNIVDGYIEFSPLAINDIGIIINEEGELLELPPKFAITSYEGRHTEVILGNVIFVGTKHIKEEGIVETSLSDEQISFIQNDLFIAGELVYIESTGEYVPVIEI